MTIGNNI